MYLTELKEKLVMYINLCEKLESQFSSSKVICYLYRIISF